jgi:hypothetical protein
MPVNWLLAKGLASPAFLPWRMARALGRQVPLLLALLACGLSAAALWRSAPMAAPPIVAAPLPLVSDAPLPVIGIELLLPHLARPAPFQRPFAVAMALAAGDRAVLAALAPLQDAAMEGAPTSRQLAEGFAAVADAAVLAEMGYGTDAGWIARRAAATMRLGAALGSSSTPALHAMQRVGEALALGDLAAAEDALGTMPVGSIRAVQPWRTGLLRRMAADDAARRLAAIAQERATLPAPSRPTLALSR